MKSDFSIHFHNDKQMKRYRKKYKFIIRQIKALILKRYIPTSCLARNLQRISCQSHSFLLKRKGQMVETLGQQIEQIKNENAALCDEVARNQESISIVKDERKFLLHKLLEYENDMDSAQSCYRSKKTQYNNCVKNLSV